MVQDKKYVRDWNNDGNGTTVFYSLSIKIWNIFGTETRVFFSLVITNLSGSVISFFSSFLFIFSLFFCSYYLVLIFLLFQWLFQRSTRNWCTLNLALIVSECGNTFELLPGFNWRIDLNWNYLSLEKKCINVMKWSNAKNEFLRNPIVRLAQCWSHLNEIL